MSSVTFTGLMEEHMSNAEGNTGPVSIVSSCTMI